MKHTQHTPGPWVYSPAVACVFVEQDRIHCPQICTLPAFTPENTVNGCLIAAAPDMLAALVRVLDFEQRFTACKADGGIALVSDIRAAIAKATGQG